MNTFTKLLIQELQQEVEILQEVENASTEKILESINSDARIRNIKNQNIELYNTIIKEVIQIS